MKKSFPYDMEVTTIRGETITLEQYRGHVLLVVNTASKCGLTPQYSELEKLYQEHKESGLVILGFPCNQFGNQEPGSADQILSFCEINYGVTFPIFAKVDVNGQDTHPLFEQLKTQAPGLLGSHAIKWNFTKFLINRNGEILKRFPPTTVPKEIAPAIESALNA